MPFCINCGHEVGKSSLHCPNCGTSTQAKVIEHNGVVRYSRALFAGGLGWLVGYGAFGMIPVYFFVSAGYRPFGGSVWFSVMEGCFQGARQCTIDFGIAASIVGWVFAFIFFAIVSLIFKRNEVDVAKLKAGRIIEVLFLIVFILAMAYIAITSGHGRGGGTGMFIVLVSIGIASFYARRVLLKIKTNFMRRM